MAGVGVLGVVVLVGWIQLTSGTGTNVAQNKPASMSSVFWSSPPAGAAVDGIILANDIRYSVVTQLNKPSAWWKVDLQTQVQSARVTLYFRTDYKSRRNGVQLYTSMTNSSDPKEGNLCHSVTGRPNGTDIPDVLNVTCPGTWRYLTVYTETDNDGYGPVLDFVEVQVWTCASGYYGSNCDQSCAARHCKSDSSCDVIGLCDGGCAAGYQGTDCAQACAPEYYGADCGQLCAARHCKMDSSCHDKIQGQCVGGCAAGYQGTDCTQACDPGRYGEGCSKSCGGRRCKTPSVTCDHVTGRCPDGCQSGFMGNDCFQTCDPGRYGEGCSKYCGNRRCKTPSDTCDHVTGMCPDGCESGFMGNDCVQTCTSMMYGPNCASSCSSRHCKTPSSICDRATGQCPDGCEDGWTEIDCSRTCASMMYGPSCASNCSSRHCKTPSSTCDRVTGQCPGGCEDGWTEIDCSRMLANCPPGRYGPGCTQFCNSRNCETPSPVCDVTGSCTDGCRDGWKNVDCRIPCPSGKYGSNCSKSCDSRQCKTARVACDHETGTCAAGCREGWIGTDCTQKCKPGTYGRDCSRCGHCDVTCNDGDGRCPGECLDGFTGDRCDVDVRVSPVTTGVIGGAVGIAVLLLLIGGLMICLLRAGRLKWIPTTTTDPQELRKTDTPNTGEMSTHAPISHVNDQDYTELNDFTRENDKSPYDVIQNENNQI